MAYKGPQFPLNRQLRNGSPQHLLEIIHRNLSGDLRSDFAKRVAEIRQKERDGYLGPKGTADALRALRQEFEEIITTKSWGGGDSFNEFFGRVRMRVSELQARLTARSELPADTPQHLLMRRELQQHRVIGEFLKLEPAARRAAVAGAREKLTTGDETARLFLSDILAQPGVLDQATAQRIENDLMQGSDPQAFRELEEFLGPITNGQRDEIGGAVPVTEYSLKLFRDYMDEECGTNSAVEAGRALLENQLKTPGPALELTEEQGRDPSLYRLARDMAQQHGRVLSISGPQGEGSINPAGNSR